MSLWRSTKQTTASSLRKEQNFCVTKVVRRVQFPPSSSKVPKYNFKEASQLCLLLGGSEVAALSRDFLQPTRPVSNVFSSSFFLGVTKPRKNFNKRCIHELFGAIKLARRQLIKLSCTSTAVNLINSKRTKRIPQNNHRSAKSFYYYFAPSRNFLFRSGKEKLVEGEQSGWNREANLPLRDALYENKTPRCDIEKEDVTGGDSLITHRFSLSAPCVPLNTLCCRQHHAPAVAFYGRIVL